MSRADSAGHCAVCAGDLNREPHAHDAVSPDPRWAALAKLRERL